MLDLFVLEKRILLRLLDVLLNSGSPEHRCRVTVDLVMYQYKILLTQELFPNDASQWLQQYFTESIEVGPASIPWQLM